MSKLTKLRELTCNVVGGIWEDLEITLTDRNQNIYADVAFSPPDKTKDEEIMLIAHEVLSERT